MIRWFGQLPNYDLHQPEFDNLLLPSTFVSLHSNSDARLGTLVAKLEADTFATHSNDFDRR